MEKWSQFHSMLTITHPLFYLWRLHQFPVAWLCSKDGSDWTFPPFSLLLPTLPSPFNSLRYSFSLLPPPHCFLHLLLGPQWVFLAILHRAWQFPCFGSKICYFGRSHLQTIFVHWRIRLHCIIPHSIPHFSHIPFKSILFNMWIKGALIIFVSILVWSKFHLSRVPIIAKLNVH